MKVTKKQLSKIIKEELTSVLKEEIPPLVADAMDLVQDHFEVVTELAITRGTDKDHLIEAVTRLIEIDYEKAARASADEQEEDDY